MPREIRVPIELPPLPDGAEPTIYDFGDGIQVRVLGVPEEEFYELADVEVEEMMPVAHVRLSTWRNSGEASERTNFIEMPSSTMADPKTGQPFPLNEAVTIYDPSRLTAWTVGEDVLPALTQQGGEFWRIAAMYGAQEIAMKHGPIPEGWGVTASYEGWEVFEEPVQKDYSINHDVDTLVGNLVFDVFAFGSDVQA